MDYVLFEAAGLIKTALVREWTMLPDEDIASLRQYLLHYIINKPTLALFVRERILQVIAIMVKRGSVRDGGQERKLILNEVEELIRSGDRPRVRKIQNILVIRYTICAQSKIVKSSSSTVKQLKLHSNTNNQKYGIRLASFAFNCDGFVQKYLEFEYREIRTTYVYLSNLTMFLKSSNFILSITDKTKLSSNFSATSRLQHNISSNARIRNDVQIFRRGSDMGGALQSQKAVRDNGLEENSKICNRRSSRIDEGRNSGDEFLSDKAPSMHSRGCSRLGLHIRALYPFFEISINCL